MRVSILPTVPVRALVGFAPRRSRGLDPGGLARQSRLICHSRGSRGEAHTLFATRVAPDVATNRGAYSQGGVMVAAMEAA